jgi:hypothetical protein
MSLQDQTPPRVPDKRAAVFRHERRKRSARLPKPIDHAGLFRPPERKRVHTANRRDVPRTFDLDDRPPRIPVLCRSAAVVDGASSQDLTPVPLTADALMAYYSNTMLAARKSSCPS